MIRIPKHYPFSVSVCTDFEKPKRGGGGGNRTPPAETWPHENGESDLEVPGRRFCDSSSKAQFLRILSSARCFGERGKTM